MTDQEKITALAAELTRLGKMPPEIQVDSDRIARLFSWENDSISSPKITLAALSGVAAEVLADHQSLEASIRKRPLNDGYSLFTCKSYEFYPTYHEALIMALRLVEKEKKQ